MPTVKFSPIFNHQVVDSSGDPASGWKIYTYAAASSTALATYTDSTGNTPQSNPIVINSLGFPTVGQIWLTSGLSYKLVLTNASDVVQKEEDNITGVNDTSISVDEWTSSGLTPTYVSATQFTLSGDQTTEFHVNRRLKSTISAGTGYHTITATAFGAVTTVTVSGTSLDSGLSAIALGVLRAVNPSVPAMATKGDLLTRNSAGLAALSVGTNAYIVHANSGSATGMIYLPPSFAQNILNGYISESRGSNAATYAIKGWDGNDPSSTNPVFVLIRSTTPGTGLPLLATITAANSLTINSTATMGASNAIPFKLWFVLFDDAGTYRLATINCLSGTNIYPLGQFPVASSTAMTTASDSAQVFYSASAVSAKAYSILGYASYESGLTTAGTWDAAPTRIQMYYPGIPLPSSVVQPRYTQTGAVDSGAGTIDVDDTIPAITEGNEFMTLAITPTSTTNVLHIESNSQLSNSGAAQVAAGLWKDAVSPALAVNMIQGAGTGQTFIPVTYRMLAATVSSTTFRLRAGPATASGGTLTFNGVGGARLMGGVASSFMKIDELMT